MALLMSQPKRYILFSCCFSVPWLISVNEIWRTYCDGVVQDGHACLKAMCFYWLWDGPLFISVVTDKQSAEIGAVVSLYAQYSPLPLLPLESIYILHSIETYWCLAKQTEAGKFAKIFDFSAIKKHLADILITGLVTWTALHQSDEVLPVSRSQSYNADLPLSITPLHFIAS